MSWGDDGAATYAPATTAVSGRTWATLAVLTAVYTLHSIDRAIIGVLIEPLKHEFALTDSRLGVLTGLAYGVLYAVAGLFVGYFIDRVNRRNLLALLVLLWSGCTALSGLAGGFASLFAARSAVGIAESGAVPTIMSILGDIFPPRRRATAVAIFTASAPIGLAFAAAMGGYVAGAYGWRAAFFIAGVPGLLIIPVVLLVIREPRRGAMDAVAAQDVPPTVAEVWRSASRRPAFIYSLLAMTTNAMAGAGLLTWAPSLFVRNHGVDLFHAGLILAVAAVSFGTVGTVLGGVAGDRLAKRGLSGLALTPVASALLACAAMVITLLAATLWQAVLGWALFEFTYRSYFGPANTMIISTVEPRMRGMTGSVSQAVLNLMGFAMGPTLVGFVSDRVGGAHALQWGMASASVFLIATAMFFLLASRAIRKGEEKAGS